MLNFHSPNALVTTDMASLVKICGTYIRRYGMNADDEKLNHQMFRDTITAIFGKNATTILNSMYKTKPNDPELPPPSL